MKLLILAVALLAGLYRVLLNLVKLRSANNPTPREVADVYDSQTYETWRRYSAAHCRLQILFDLLSIVAVLTLLATNVYAAFAGLFPKGIFWQLFAVVLLDTLVSRLFDIPRSYVANMVIEQKYGFNRTKGKTFVADQLRSLLIELFLSTLLAYLIYTSHFLMGNYMALLFAGLMVLISLGATFLHPFLSRIGNKFTPLEEGELKDRLMQLLTSHGYRVRAIEVMDASRRTTKSNAYFTGFGKMKTIVLFDNLINSMTPDEICAVFAHELGHGLHKDTTKLQLINLCNFALMGLAAWALVSLESIYHAFGFAQINYGMTYILLGISISLITPLTGLVINAFSRRFEYRADLQAVREGYGAHMIPALKKLARDNFDNLSPSPLYVLLEYSHPPIYQRIAAIERELEKQK